MSAAHFGANVLSAAMAIGSLTVLESGFDDSGLCGVGLVKMHGQ